MVSMQGPLFLIACKTNLCMLSRILLGHEMF